MNNSKISMLVSVAMNVINIAGNAVLIYGFSMGVAGVGYATLLSQAVACVIMLILIRKPKYEIHITSHRKLGWFPQIIRNILHIGVPLLMNRHLWKHLTMERSMQPDLM